MIAEYDTTGKLTTSYGWKPGSTWSTDPILTSKSGKKYFYHNDHLGAPHSLTDTSGKDVWQAAYDVYGDVKMMKEEVRNNLRFPGQYFDEESGLYYNWYRFYDPTIGRYLNADPIGLDGGMNLYAYVEGDPVNWIDPWGLMSLSELLRLEWHPEYPPTPLGCERWCKSKGEHYKSFVMTGEGGLCRCKKNPDCYENPGHHDPSNTGQNPYNSNKSVLPENHQELWEQSRLGSDGNRWTKIGTGKKAEYHRFQNDGNGNWHWNGSSNGVTRNGSPRIIKPNDIPKEVKRW